MIVPASQVDPALWPLILHKRHDDWIFPLSLIKRSATAYFGPPPVKIAGNAPEFDFWYRQVGEHVWRRCSLIDEGAVLFRHPYPIPERGEWWRGMPDYWACTGENGWHSRRGYRWDDVDSYYNHPSNSLKKRP